MMCANVMCLRFQTNQYKDDYQYKCIAQLLIRWPEESMMDWLKFNPFKLKAIVLTHKGIYPKKKCKLRELLGHIINLE